jgi:hypothetical protein
MSAEAAVTAAFSSWAGDVRGHARAPARADGQPRPDEAFDVA